MEVSKSLEWREGDAITSEHRDAVAAKLAAAFRMSKADEANTRADAAALPETAIAEHLAVLIAEELKMDAATFSEQFPATARNGKSMSLKFYLEHADEFARLASRVEGDLDVM